jgi:protein TonB
MSQINATAVPPRVIGLGLVILLHIGIVIALATGLSHSVVEVIRGPMETEIIDEVKDESEPPPPPPPEFKQPPPAFVDMPLISVETAQPATTAIQAVTNVKAPTAPPPAPKPKAAATEPRSDPKRPITQPEYPATSVRLGEEGAVILKFMVQPNGRVDGNTISVVESSGSERLDKAAMAEARKAWKFIPATEDGKPVAAWYQFRVVFELKKQRG